MRRARQVLVPVAFAGLLVAAAHLVLTPFAGFGSEVGWVPSLPPAGGAREPIMEGGARDIAGRQQGEAGRRTGVEPKAVAQLFGRVLDQSGKAVQATVYARAAPPEVGGAQGEHPPAGPLAVVEVSENGLYALELDLDGEQVRVDVGAVAEGYLRALVRDVPLREGGSQHLDIFLERGLSLSGVALVGEGEGEGLEGLAVVAVRKGRQDCSHPRVQARRLGAEGLRFPDRHSAHFEGAAVTGPEGRFSIHGLAPGTYCVLPMSHEWHPAALEGLEAGTEGATLRFVPAQALLARVVDRTTGTPVTDTYLRVRLEQPPGRVLDRTGGIAQAPGQAYLVWPDGRCPSEQSAPWAMEVTVLAPGYVSGRHRVEVEAGGALTHAEILMERAEAREVELAVAYADGRPCAEPLRVRSDAEGFQRVLWPQRPGGGYRVWLPPGAQALTVAPRDAFGSDLAWRERVHVPAGPEADVLEVVLPLAGVVELVVDSWTAEEGALWRYSLENLGPGPPRRALGSLEGGRGRILMPAGRWAVRVRRQGRVEFSTEILTLPGTRQVVRVP